MNTPLLPPSQTQRPIFSSRRLGLVLTLSLASGLFIWAKLRMVAAVPRTAYAEPAPGEDADRKGKNGKPYVPPVRTAHAEDEPAGDHATQP